VRRAAALGLAVVGVLLLHPVLSAAQCSMCSQTVTGAVEGQAFAERLNGAILVMFFAPYAVFGTLAAVLLRSRIRAHLHRLAGRRRV
jgi:hypothetical protein